MRYLTLAEALIIAEAVTGIESRTLANASRVELLDSALHAPQAGFGDEDFYPTLTEKAAVLAVRVARNHALPDGKQAPRVAVAHHVPRAQRPPSRSRRRQCREPHGRDRERPAR